MVKKYLLLFMGLFFACLYPLEAHADAMPDVIRYEELETLVKASSPQIQMEQAQYDSRLARYENAREEIMETRRLLREEAEDLEKNIKEGTSTLPFPEKYRVMFEGIPCWPKLPNLFKPLKANGVNVTAVVYAPAFGFVYNGLDEMARAYYKAPNSVCIEQGVDWREGICRDNKVDGVLVHYNRSCKPWSGYMAEMQRRFTKDLGVPCAGFDGDQADPRNFNEAQYETRVQGLVEAMEANQAAKEGAEK